MKWINIAAHCVFIMIVGCGGSPDQQTYTPGSSGNHSAPQVSNDGGGAPQADDVECHSSADCSDGIYCNGVERCVNGECQTGTAKCAAANEICLEVEHVCQTIEPLSVEMVGCPTGEVTVGTGVTFTLDAGGGTGEYAFTTIAANANLADEHTAWPTVTPTTSGQVIVKATVHDGEDTAADQCQFTVIEYIEPEPASLDGAWVSVIDNPVTYGLDGACVYISNNQVTTWLRACQFPNMLYVPAQIVYTDIGPAFGFYMTDSDTLFAFQLEYIDDDTYSMCATDGVYYICGYLIRS
ncbi:MAG: hypothetical protein HJJLKODD_03009 [Phycisphaerae bacterium]|nr:hypothetical protein [Phycisphaerae bacterium]MCG3139130.1 hypothetical protein [Phycisphaerae bacterium]